MISHIFTLSRYLLRSLLLSLAGILYILLALAYWWLLFDPSHRTPDNNYYILVLGMFGAAYSFLATLTVAGRANQAINYTLLVRLPSRVEYLAAVFITSVFFATGLQLLLAFLATLGGPDLSLGRALEIPPIWLALNILISVLTLHATDLVTAGWSRVYVFGLLALLLFSQGANYTISGWLSELVNRGSGFLYRQGWANTATSFNSFANWLSNSGPAAIGQLLGFIFWPFRAIVDAIVEGSFSRTQALAPAILLLYATILFMLAADIFATKDLSLTE